MSYPNVNGFGVKLNPLVYSPFEQNNSPDDMFAHNYFLLLNAQYFMLLNGLHFALLEA